VLQTSNPSPVASAIQSLWPRPHDPTARDRRLVAAIRARAQQHRQLSDKDLVDLTLRLREQVAQGAGSTFKSILVPSFALVCEAVRRTLGIDYYDVQLMAGLALSRHAIAEAQTGEGKTLVAALPAFLFALSGRGCHVVTVNDYLADRDCCLVTPLFEQLGMTVGNMRPQSPLEQKQAAYACDITYGPGYEFGFDYLRDQLALLTHRTPALGETLLQRLNGATTTQAQQVQRGLEMAIVDEIDSVLIDEATSPLVLSGAPQQLAANAGVYIQAMRIATALVADHDFVVDTAKRHVYLTAEGETKANADLPQMHDHAVQRPWTAYVEQALRARLLLKRDVDYIVRDDKVLLVDEATGRIFADRSLRQGLHQAVEAKEKAPITAEQQPLARISRQRYFRLYQGLCGMTGTATGNERELWSLYRLPVVRIPRHHPCRRRTLPPRYFVDQEAKEAALTSSVKRLNQLGQPVLVGTRTIDRSAALAERFETLGIPYQLLNGTQDAEEADIVARAGTAGAVTIATNMAGRGTDIKLAPGAEACGGLHVIGGEPHDSARVDRQLIGRAARQADPGSCQRMVAADDALIACHAPALAKRMRRLADRSGEIHVDLGPQVARAQRSAERLGYNRRRQLLAQDQWLEDVLVHLAKRS
jgi:preprotein translocase subunit SecA